MVAADSSALLFLPMVHDLIIRNVLLCDGLGNPPRSGSLAVTDGRISGIGDGLDEARETIDGSGLVLAPGFVDIHTHYDAQLTWDSAAMPSPALGVTTLVIGNCGFTLAPCKPDNRGAILRDLTKIEGMPLEALQAGVHWNFTTIPEYMDALEHRGIVPNVACFAGHTSIRAFVMGEAAARRKATPDELAAMRQILSEALAAGAIGFATSTLEMHNGDKGIPVASRFADLEEFRTLSGVLKEAGRGVFQITKGVATGIDFLTEIAAISGRPVHVCPMLIDPNKPEEVFAEMAAIAEASAHHHEIYGQVSPFPELLDFTLEEPYPLESIDAWRPAMASTDRAARKRIYADPAFRAAVKAELDTPATTLRFGGQWDMISVLATPAGAGDPRIGRSIAELAAEHGQQPLDYFLDLGLAEDLRTRFRILMCNSDIDAVRELMSHPDSLIGLGDAGAHLTLFCQAGTGLYLLQHHVRERPDFSLEEAVRMLTSRPADAFRIPDRGRLVVGAHADLLLFDPDTVGLGEKRLVSDLPGGAARLTTPALGVTGVWVNGRRIVDETGLMQPAPLAGTLLRQFSA